jgi:hypothetical protein
MPQHAGTGNGILGNITSDLLLIDPEQGSEQAI